MTPEICHADRRWSKGGKTVGTEHVGEVDRNVPAVKQRAESVLPDPMFDDLSEKSPRLRRYEDHLS